jgi:pimeloyl-ACP methyl ester carboxylesterase
VPQTDAGPQPATHDPRPTDPPGRLVDTDAGPVHVVDEGRGPPVLLVHGLPGSTRDFRYLGPALAARGVRAIRVDLPGLGGTPSSSGHGPTLAGAARTIVDVARALALSRFVLCGHSFGGAICLHAAARLGDRVAALAMINGPGPVRHRGYLAPSAAHAAVAALLRAPAVGARLAPVVQRMYQSAGFKPDVVPKDPAQLAAIGALVATLDFRAIRRELATIDVPVLVASSDDDPFIEPFVPRASLRALPPTALRTHLHAREGGHYLQKHQAAAIAAWIARVAR